MNSVTEGRTIPELLDRLVTAYGSTTAIIDGSEVITYKNLKSRCDDFAKSLLAKGINKGDAIGILCPNRWEWIVACLGSQLIGAIVVPLNTRMRSIELEEVITRSNIKLIVMIGEFIGVYYPDLLSQNLRKEIDLVVVGVAHTDQAWNEFLSIGRSITNSKLKSAKERVKPNSVLDLLFTSGTSGVPKGVLTSHQQNIRTFSIWADRARLLPGDKYLIVAPFFHSFGYKAGWLAAFLKGAVVLPHQIFNATEILNRIDVEGITVLPGPPTLFTEILGHSKRPQYDITSLRVAVTGSASVAPSLVRAMREELGIEVVLTAYGLSESSGLVTMCHFDDTPEIIANSCGQVIPGCEIYIRSLDDSVAGSNQQGEVMVRGFNVMLGYFDDLEGTKEAIRPDGWMHTGDIGYMDDKGYLYLTDRLKEMFIVGGFNCYPAEIERLILEHPDVLEAAVIGVEDDRLGEVGKAFIVLKNDSFLTKEDLLKWCKVNIANFKVPRYFEFIKSLPKNASGKVLRKELKV